MPNQSSPRLSFQTEGRNWSPKEQENPQSSAHSALDSVDTYLFGHTNDVRIFIMKNYGLSEIEIELILHHNTGGVRHVIRRVIDWNKLGVTGRGCINKEVVNVKTFQKLVTDTYLIAIDNLCTFPLLGV